MPTGVTARPSQGWLRATREHLGISRQVVATRLKVTQAAVRDYEAAEMREAISLATLRRVADVLGCEVVVALVPKGSRERANTAPALSPSEAGPQTPAAADELASHLK